MLVLTTAFTIHFLGQALVLDLVTEILVDSVASVVFTIHFFINLGDTLIAVAHGVGVVVLEMDGVTHTTEVIGTGVITDFIIMM